AATRGPIAGFTHEAEAMRDLLKRLTGNGSMSSGRAAHSANSVTVAAHTEESFRLLVEGVQGYAIFMLDPQGQVITWNPGAQRIKGYQAEEIIGQHFSQFYTPDAVQRGWPD